MRCENINNKIGVYGRNGYSEKYDYVISSLPNKLNRQFFGLSETQNFSFRNVILVYLKTGQPSIIKGQCLYVYSKEVKAVRITDFSNFPHKKIVANILLVEYWVGSTGLWEESDTTIINTVRDDLKKMDITVSFEDFYIKKMNNAYRVPEYGLPEKLINESLDIQSPNFFSIGRSNSPYFNYGMDTAITESVNFVTEGKVNEIV